MGEGQNLQTEGVFLNNKSLIETRKTLEKHGLAPEKILKIESDNFYGAYQEVGRVFSEPINKSFLAVFENKTDNGKNSASEKVAVVKSLAKRLQKLSEEDSEIGQYSRELIDSLNGWAEGSGLNQKAKDYGLTPLEAALILENDNVGCQSFMARSKDGGVIVMHTEEDEDIKNRVSDFHFTEIKVAGEVRNSFAYNNLLPGGAAFGDSADFMMTTDYLRTKTPIDKKGFDGLVNITSWMIWRVGQKADIDTIKRIVEKTGPFVDGYAVNIVRKNQEGNIEAFKVIFVGDQIQVEKLLDTPGAYIAQTNMIDPELETGNPALYAYSQEPYSMPHDETKMYKGYYGKYLKRIDRIAGAVKQWGSLLNKNLTDENPNAIHKTLQRIMSLRTKFNWGLANNNVAATYSGYMCKDVQTSAVGLGPTARSIEPKDLYIRTTQSS